MEKSCTVNLLTQKQTLSWKGVALAKLHCKPFTQKQTLSWKGVAL